MTDIRVPNGDRLEDLRKFYELLGELEHKLGTPRSLGACNGKMAWPDRGVYFFFEAGERRSNSGDGPRVVRVGTHALSETSRTRLWGRLAQHRGTAGGRGNHRGSVFRKLVGDALKQRDDTTEPASWGIDGDPGSAARRLGIERQQLLQGEQALEANVSRQLEEMPFLWLKVDGPGGPGNLRGYIEQNAIALLSNFDKEALDSASPQWLGRYSNQERVKKSGLWNSNHVCDPYDRNFLITLRQFIEAT